MWTRWRQIGLRMFPSTPCSNTPTYCVTPSRTVLRRTELPIPLHSHASFYPAWEQRSRRQGYQKIIFLQTKGYLYLLNFMLARVKSHFTCFVRLWLWPACLSRAHHSMTFHVASGVLVSSKHADDVQTHSMGLAVESHAFRGIPGCEPGIRPALGRLNA